MSNNFHAKIAKVFTRSQRVMFLCSLRFFTLRSSRGNCFSNNFIFSLFPDQLEMSFLFIIDHFYQIDSWL